MDTHYTVSDYLLDRLKDLGLDHVFGVPGDYAFPLLAKLEDRPDLQWIGDCNEHNAGLAADGYARTKGFAAVLTTCGPGEMGVASALGGSYAEQVPVVNIVGHPPLQMSSGYRMTHHSLNGDFTRYGAIFGNLTAAHAELGTDDACAEIDRVLQGCWAERRPGWIAIPKDVQTMPAQRPSAKLTLPEPKSDPAELDAFVAAVVSMLGDAKRPAILADLCVGRYQLTPLVERLVATSGIPLAACYSAQSAFIDEGQDGYLGCYYIAFKEAPAYVRIENADCLIRLGVQTCETNTGRADPDWTAPFVIDLRIMGASIGTRRFPKVAMADALERLRDAVPRNLCAASERGPGKAPPFSASADKPMTEDALLAGIAAFLREGDIFIVDQGTCSAASALPKPKQVRTLCQFSWASIGYGLPMTLGSSVADPHARHVLVIGDGGFQMTAQALSTILRHKFAPVIFLFNNATYLIENIVGGTTVLDNAYNAINPWDYDRLIDVLAPGGNGIGIKVESEEGYARALEEAATAQANGKCVLIDVRLARDDVSKISNQLNSPTRA